MRFVEGEGAHLEDLIAGKTPTYVDWTADPTDGVNITDNDISTFCTTGNKVTGGGWITANIEWNLNNFYNVIATFVGHVDVTGGTGYIFVEFWDGTGWIQGNSSVVSGANILYGAIFGGKCSKVRIVLTSSAASTNTPNIREFQVWRI